MLSRPLSLCLLLSLSLVSGLHAEEDYRTWTGEGETGAFDDPVNWSPQGVPDSYDTISFTLDDWSAYLWSNASVARMDVWSDGSLDLWGWNFSADQLSLESFLTLRNGTASIGSLEATNGHLFLGEAGNSEVAAYMDILQGLMLGGGESDEGHSSGISVLGGSQLSVSDFEVGTFQMGYGYSGAWIELERDSMMFVNMPTAYIGHSSWGTISIGEGASAEFRDIVLGYQAFNEDTGYLGDGGIALDDVEPDEYGHVWFAEVASLRANDVVVGYEGSGSLSVGAGRRADFNSLVVAERPGSNGYVWINGGELRVFGAVEVGKEGNGQLFINSGGRFSTEGEGSAPLRIATGETGHAYFSASGEGTEVRVGNTHIVDDSSGHAQFTIDSGAQMNSDGNVFAGSGADIAVSGFDTYWNIEGDLHTSAYSMSVTQAKVKVAGSVHGSGGISVLAGGTIQVGDVFDNDGTLELGNGIIFGDLHNAGTLVLSCLYEHEEYQSVIDGSFVQETDATIVFNPYMLLEDENPMLRVAGDAELAGSIDLIYLPGLGMKIPLLQVEGSRIGSFDNANPEFYHIWWEDNVLWGEMVPEPSTYALMLMGAGAVLWYARRRKVA